MSSEEKETFLACNHIGMMIDHCEKMINLAKNADQPPSSAEKLINSGIVKSFKQFIYVIF